MKQALVIAAMFLFLVACSFPGTDGPPAAAGLKLIRIPLVRQATDYTCGVAAVQAVLGYYDVDVRENELYSELRPDTKMGTNTRNMVKSLRLRGFDVSVSTGAQLSELKKALDLGKPVIVAIQAWGKKSDYSAEWEDGHFVVAIGYDSNNIYFMDPSTLGHYAYIPEPEFLTRWHDYEKEGKLIRFMLAASKNIPRYNPEKILKVQ